MPKLSEDVYPKFQSSPDYLLSPGRQPLVCKVKLPIDQMLPILFGSVRFFNVDMLINLAGTSKSFVKRKDVKYVINSQLRILVISGLSTLDRLKYWNYRTRFAFYRRKYQGLYWNLLDAHS
jgi:hypothetical protein